MSFLSVKGGYAARAVMLLALVFSANAAYAGKVFYSGNAHALDSVRLGALGHTSETFDDSDAGWTGVLSGSRGTFDAIVVGENYSSGISSATKATIASYVTSGGRIIIASDHAGKVDFMNSTFGYTTTLAYGCESSEDVAGSLQPGAAGTQFSGGPPTVANLSCTSALNPASVPAGAATIYAGAATTVAFAADYGSGQLVWLGWDYCCGSTQPTDDWYLVLDSSIRFSGLFTTCAAKGYIGAKLTLCRQVCEIPQKKTTLAGLAQLFLRTYRSPAPCGAVLATLR